MLNMNELCLPYRWGGPMTPWGVCWEAPGRDTSLPRRSISALAASTPQTVTHTCRNITELTRGKNRSAVLVVPTSPPLGETWESISVFTPERSRFPALSVCTARLTAVISRSMCGPMIGSLLCLLSHQMGKMCDQQRRTLLMHLRVNFMTWHVDSF